MTFLSDPYPLSFENALGEPVGRGVIRQQPQDFQVDEELGFEPCGEGEHLYLQICKTGLNTHDVAKQLADWAGIKPVDVGLSGLKDRQAVTSQWFSLYLPGTIDPDVTTLNADNLQVLAWGRHNRKLRRGEHFANRFALRIREFDGDPVELAARLARIADQGVPNYFGEQRFGRGGNNLLGAHQMWERRQREKNRQLRSFYLSAARSYLFNRLLSQRVTLGCWSSCIPGDVEEPDTLNHTAWPTGPLWGRGRLPTSDQALALEEGLRQSFPLFCDGLEHAGLQQERRSLVLKPRDFRADLSALAETGSFSLSFELPPGAFATSVLAELINWTDNPNKQANNEN